MFFFTVNSWRNAALTFLLSSFLFGQTGAAQSPIGENDLAIAMPLESLDLLSGKSPLQGGTQLLPQSWYEQISKGYSYTSIGEGFERESPYSDWRLVSLRIVPCAPLGKTPGNAINSICWPEIRLVWQPILRKIRLHERYMLAAADDRAVHAIYPLPSRLVLNAAEVNRLQGHLESIKSYIPESAAYTPLDKPRLADFIQLRNRVINRLLIDTLALRSKARLDTQDLALGVRPEMLESRSEQQAFLERLQSLLSSYTRPDDLRALTTFSLPEGREPAHIDEWVFLAFRAQESRLSAENIQIHSRRNGQVLANLGSSNTGTQSRDDDRLYDLLDGSNAAAELQSSVMLFTPDIASMTPAIQDRLQTLVPNTSCVSCHKMNDLRFDFHNFSYLEDRDLTISPRVTRDVELDLLWLKQHQR